MKITPRARDEILTRLSALPADYDGIALYERDIDSTPAISDQIWETDEAPGWHLDFIPSAHLALEAVEIVCGIRVFPRPADSNAVLDYDGRGFSLNGEDVYTKR